MKTISKTALVALMTASVGVAALAPAAYAQTVPAQQVEVPQAHGEMAKRFPHGDHDGKFERRMMMMRHMGGLGGHGPHGAGLLNFGSAEALEIAFVRLSYAIDMSDEQRQLFDTLKTDALAAQADFAAATEGLRPDREAEPAELPDMLTMFDNRITLETARLEAMQTVQPAFEAFFNSLTDEQKAELAPRRMHMQRPGIPGGPNAPELPAPDAQSTQG
ncbi:Spy/CpxP family protein refolding chaperone [Devosia nitrariae]|uniref:LTXXQ motif family protein n=1 Tax=Devosia nitrariae TaxID=2071872 RepID=A0ABQ5VYE8_9HYPH|nr:Spy/CpxP family protein refolding chaperone [Devosia nitrariae]GLQ52752.1 hypothetical protein GCM10010862_00100 [Devosia nitrariae]